MTNRMIVQVAPARPATVQAPAVDVLYIPESRTAPGSTLELLGPIVLGIRLAPAPQVRAAW